MKVVFTKTEAEKFIRNAYLQQGFSSVDVVIIEDATVEAEAEDKAVAEKPWYPDNGNWIEIEPHCLPNGLEMHTNVEVLFRSERIRRSYYQSVEPVIDHDWRDVVAYKVVE